MDIEDVSLRNDFFRSRDNCGDAPQGDLCIADLAWAWCSIKGVEGLAPSGKCPVGPFEKLANRRLGGLGAFADGHGLRIRRRARGLLLASQFRDHGGEGIEFFGADCDVAESKLFSSGGQVFGDLRWTADQREW